jgi:hypothetical protein
VLPRRVISFVNRTLVTETTIAFEIQFHILSATQSAHRIPIPCHLYSILLQTEVCISLVHSPIKEG